MLRKPCIHLWSYNHPFHTISDQANFFLLALQQQGYPVSIGRRPRSSSLNVVIEGFSSERSRDVLVGFCRSWKKRVAVIMTEHLDFQNNEIYFHGAPLGSENDYMHPAASLARAQYLVECLPYLKCFFVLGDLPELRNMSTILPGLDVRTIPFPKLGDCSRDDVGKPSEMLDDLVFTGSMTEHRVKLLALLEKNGLSVACPQRFVSRNCRNALNRSGRLVVNIPQRQGWNWLSLMRIVAGLQTGRATISLGTHDTSHIASCCTQLDTQEHDWVSKVKECIKDWKSLYIRDLMGYSIMAKKFEEARPFPHDVFEYWSVTDRVCH